MDALLAADIMEFVYGVAALATGILVLALGPGKKSNQALGWLLIVDGIGMGGITAQMRWWDWLGAQTTWALANVTGISFAIVPALYILFIGRALRGPVARACQNPFLMLAFLAMGLIAHFEYRATSLGAQGVNPQLQVLGLVTLVTSGLLGLIAAIQNLRRATGTDRRRARAYLWAFAIRDLGYVLGYGVLGLLSIWLDTGRGTLPNLIGVLWLQGTWLLFLVFLLYGILTGQIIDLDRRFRIGISYSSAAGIIAVLFVIATETLERVIGGGTWTSMGVAVAAALVFRPVQSLTEKGALRMLPRGDVDPSTYQAALAQALQDGVITPREQAVLDDLRTRMS